jgi:hypothetical protein
MIEIDMITMKYSEYHRYIDIRFDNESILYINCYEQDEYTLKNIAGDDDTGLLDLNYKKQLKIIGIDELL